MLSHTRRKNPLDSQSAFCTHSAVCSQHFVLGLHFVSGLQSAFCTNRYPWHQYSLFLVTVIRTTHNLPQNTCVWVNSIDTFVLFRVNTLLSFCKNESITSMTVPWNVKSRGISKVYLPATCISAVNRVAKYLFSHPIFIILTEFISHHIILQTHPRVIYIRNRSIFFGTPTQVLVFGVIFCTRFVAVVTSSSYSPSVTCRRRNDKRVTHIFPSLWVLGQRNNSTDLDRFWESDINGR